MFWEWKSEESFQFICLYEEGLWLLGKNNLVKALGGTGLGKSGEGAG